MSKNLEPFDTVMAIVAVIMLLVASVCVIIKMI